MNDIEILKSQIEICELHKSRIELALKHVYSLIPIEPAHLNEMSEENLGFLELMTSRFAKLQDTIGKKIFPFMLKIMQEYDSKQSFLDQLHKLEKLGVIDSIEIWNRLRQVRNAISHDYPEHPEMIANSLNQCVEMCKTLLAFWKKIKTYIEQHIFTYYEKNKES